MIATDRDKDIPNAARLPFVAPLTVPMDGQSGASVTIWTGSSLPRVDVEMSSNAAVMSMRINPPQTKGILSMAGNEVK